MVHQLVYCSAATHAFCPAELNELLERSRRKNKLGGITGVLVCQDRTLLQILEGERSIVHSLYRRIRLDPRHMDTTILSEATNGVRGFHGWSMGLLNANLTPHWELPGFALAYGDLCSVDDFVAKPLLADELLTQLRSNKQWRDAVDIGQGAAIGA